ncbi:surface protein [Lactococcus chungangensis CAU 28 = DSM 22330]|uniref:Surface protein n=1 Tax=Pseudolactococcus chungangensis CAU 28 = DSM 22330 TaxID=1122154 RepID=A0A1K2HDD3_9LACT|nr:BspA family leucine-rich repeat surface protein [Lactococcus chungangensis]SFZ74804.1 surface protein [Lactococcus chungangensis CAU 28 = DSM 22330]
MKFKHKLKSVWTTISRPQVKLSLTAGLIILAGALLAPQSITSYMSDITRSQTDMTLNIPKVMQIQNLKLDTHTGVKTDPTVTDPATGDVMHAGNELVTFDHMVLSDIVTLSFDLTNTGNEALTVSDGVIKLAWDKDTLPEKGYVYLYPATTSDDTIRSDINSGGASALTKNLSEDTVLLNDNTTRTGLELPISGSTLTAQDAKNYQFKVVYARRNSTQEHADFLQFNGENLKLDLYFEGETPRYRILRDEASAIMTAETMPMMMATSGTAATAKFWGQPATMSVTKQQVQNIQFVDRDVKTNPLATGDTYNSEQVVYAWDVSAAQDKTVQAWLVYTADTPTQPIVDGNGDPTGDTEVITDGRARYKLYVGGQNGVLGNAGGTNNAYFSDFRNAKTIDVDKFEVCESRSLYRYFFGTTALTSLTGQENWHTRNATTMSEMFRNSTIPTLNASGWDVSNVASMASMFYEAYKLTTLNAPNWTPGVLTAGCNMSYMFYDADAITSAGLQDINTWDTSKVTNMGYMFQYAGTTTPGLSAPLDVSGWDVSNVANMDHMFQYSGISSVNARGWHTGKVTNMSYMFDGATRLVDIDTTGWHTVALTSTYKMFAGTQSLNTVTGINTWDVSNVTSMQEMFARGGPYGNLNSGVKSLDISTWDVSKVTNMTSMFAYADKLLTLTTTSDFEPGASTGGANLSYMFHYTSSLDTINGITDWNTSKVTNMSYMFQFSGIKSSDGSSILDLHTDGTSWDVSKVTNMSNMFDGATRLVDIDTTDWDTVALTSTYKMFAGTQSLNTVTGINTWDVSNVTSMQEMFARGGPYGNLNSGVKSLDISTWNVSKVTNMTSMFAYADKLLTLTTTADFEPGVSTSGANLSYMFHYTSSLDTINGITDWNTSKVTNMSYMFQFSGIKSSDGSSILDLHTDGTSWDVSKVTNMSNMFDGATRLVDIDTTDWDTVALTSTYKMFAGTQSLNTVTGISTWDVSNVTSMQEMFARGGYYTNINSGVKTLDISTWDVSKVTNMVEMFGYANQLTYLLTDPSFEPGVSNTGTNMSRMFVGTSNLDNVEGLTYWNTSNVTNMSQMFMDSGIKRSGGGWTLLYLPTNGNAWNVSNVTNMAGMFSGANRLTGLDTTGWDTSKVTSLNSMFYNATALQNIAGIANWNTSAVTNMGATFRNASKLTSLDLSGWDTAAVTDMTYLFNGTSNLLTSIDMRNATFAQSIGVYGSMFTNNNLGLTMTVKDADAQALINSLNPHPNAVVIATP